MLDNELITLKIYLKKLAWSIKRLVCIYINKLGKFSQFLCITS